MLRQNKPVVELKLASRSLTRHHRYSMLAGVFCPAKTPQMPEKFGLMLSTALQLIVDYHFTCIPFQRHRAPVSYRIRPIAVSVMLYRYSPTALIDVPPQTTGMGTMPP